MKEKKSQRRKIEKMTPNSEKKIRKCRRWWHTLVYVLLGCVSRNKRHAKRERER